MLVRSMGAVVAAFFSTSNFSTGKLSPVSELCVTNRSFAATMRTSAGIMSPAASSTTSPGTSCETAISCGLPSRIDGGRDRDHGLELGRRAVGLGFLDEFQPHAQSDHERHHDAGPRVAGGERDARQDRQQDHQRIENRVPEQPAEARSLVSCQDVRPILSASRASVVTGQPFGTGRESRKDGRYLHRRRFNQDVRYLGVRTIVPDGGKELLGKNTRVDIEHAHLAFSPPLLEPFFRKSSGSGDHCTLGRSIWASGPVRSTFQ